MSVASLVSIRKIRVRIEATCWKFIAPERSSARRRPSGRATRSHSPIRQAKFRDVGRRFVTDEDAFAAKRDALVILLLRELKEIACFRRTDRSVGRDLDFQSHQPVGIVHRAPVRVALAGTADAAETW